MTLIARGRAQGMNCFGDSPRAILGSLVPGLGLAVGAMAQGLSEGEGARVVGDMLVPVCALLAPAVLSHELARWWGREAFWGRYIVTFNWCQWLIPIIALVLTTGAAVLHMGGMKGLIVGLAAYALWINWFIARHGLALSAWRAAGFVVCVNLGTVLLVVVPAMLVGART